MTRLSYFLSLLALLPLAASAVEIQGAGSSAAAPLYQKWAQAYTKNNSDQLNYEPAGSSAGIKKIKENQVDFGASDVAMSRADLKKAKLIQFPSAISGVVIAINVPGIRSGELRLDGTVLAAIFSGTITSWNDAAIAALNPGLRLPAKSIAAFVRQDGSGTTWNFTDYLCKISPQWQTKFGKNFTIAWNSSLSQVKGSSNISASLRKTSYSIAYIDYNYVVQDKLDVAQLQNREGKFLTPSPEGFSTALTASSWKTQGNFEETLTDKPGAKSWPITMGTFILMQQAASQVEKSRATLKFFTWAFMQGDHYVNSVDLVRLPDSMQARVFKEMTTVTDASGKPLSWDIQSTAP
ncbi:MULTISPECIES: phosphate ABC transporter substrate-binding protein PstS [unclassified Undibacterium]|nr:MULTISPECIES: phosphate ABC transporter substrate-binding protein PstS [unclassified Undibacterium]MEB0139208.1 phosphate ABC transporter substrate-binding protein PstS [Undibacterium sp. CCC2.1]MEB0172217.1 phosphate ABC transporter substrate-binding protein PstS [Undibacterium sp. CCC1.1]MEB0175926.1 phosphate ABC transporter substrate-binding protein PstS [Undibacterium sp. CCC3.4]MEB0215214.1 phosphate ABC transporter substrate-binding protein PstS [Undibacterium sp. 5I2]WPX43513.1 phos